MATNHPRLRALLKRQGHLSATEVDAALRERRAVIGHVFRGRPRAVRAKAERMAARARQAVAA